MERIARFETLTRLGFAARGMLYIMIGYLAIATGRATGSSGALKSMDGGGFSQIALGLAAIGLLGYGAWRAIEAASDTEGHGNDAKGIAVRIGHGLSGGAHILLGLLALSLTFGGLGMGATGGGSGDGQGAETTTAWLLALPGGSILVFLLAAAAFATGLAQFVQAYRLDFLEQLDRRAAGMDWVRWCGRLGYAARAVIFMLIGSFFIRAGQTEQPEQAGGLADALGSMSGWAQVALAGGLALFGVFSLVQAMYRRITNPDVVARLEAHAASAVS